MSAWGDARKLVHMLLLHHITEDYERGHNLAGREGRERDSCLHLRRGGQMPDNGRFFKRRHMGMGWREGEVTTAAAPTQSDRIGCSALKPALTSPAGILLLQPAFPMS